MNYRENFQNPPKNANFDEIGNTSTHSRRENHSRKHAPMSSPTAAAPCVLNLSDAKGTFLSDCLMYGVKQGYKQKYANGPKGDEVRDLGDFSSSAAHPAQVIAGFTLQVHPPLRATHVPPPPPQTARPSPPARQRSASSFCIPVLVF